MFVVFVGCAGDDVVHRLEDFRRAYSDLVALIVGKLFFCKKTEGKLIFTI